MADGSGGPRPEVVIIRRRAADDLTAAKGGAWKIAYADFVTAMMAFFLVMWLINAANEATRAQVASYFNPIKLTDSSTGGKGLNDPKEQRKHENKPGAAEADTKHEAMAAEEQLLEEPMKTLEKIAESAPAVARPTLPHPAPAEPLLADPFDPLAWQQTAKSGPPTATDGKTMATTTPAAEVPVAAQAPPIADPRRTEAAEAAERRRAERTRMPVETALPQAGAADPPADDVEAQHGRMRALAIKAEILKAVGVAAGDLPINLEVEDTREGLLISLTDKTDFGMFTVGSAEPEARLVDLVGAIAAALRDQPGYLVIRGHTDSRPYRNRKYDNWQLSTSRAHMAHYMLLRGGLEALRVRRIEGVADRFPKDADHPDSPVNRRIDILLGQD